MSPNSWETSNNIEEHLKENANNTNEKCYENLQRSNSFSYYVNLII